MTDSPEFRAWWAANVDAPSILAQTNAIVDELTPLIGLKANFERINQTSLTLTPADVLFLSECGEDAEDWAKRQTLWALSAAMTQVHAQLDQENKPPEVVEPAPSLPYGAFRGLFWACLFMAIAVSAVGLVIAIVERLMQ